MGPDHVVRKYYLQDEENIHTIDSQMNPIACKVATRRFTFD